MKKLDPEKPLFILGDNHGAWSPIFDIIDSNKIRNSYILSVGDLGIGFKYKKEFELKSSENLNRLFKERGINFYGIRGNHDNPFFFAGKERIAFENFELLSDYSIAEYGDKKIQFIGGAISIDRTGRKVGVSYWENEGVNFDRSLCREVDVLITHTSPSYCFPQQFNEMVYSWAREDAYLIGDLTDERAAMDEIFKICKPKNHFYGHFHSSSFEYIKDCRHRLLDINELYNLNF